MGLLTTFALWFGLRRRCRECGNALRRNVTFCQDCGVEAPFTCLDCGTPVKRGMKFCKSCGKEAFRPAASPACHVCGVDVPEGNGFCPGCGARRDQIETTADVRLRAQRWEPEIGDFAVRVDQLDLGEKLESGVVIEPGVVGVLVSNGKPETLLSPGRYQLGSLPSRKDSRMYERGDIETMALVCSGDQLLRFVFEGVRAADRVPVDVAFDAVVRARDPLAVVANVLAGQPAFRTTQFFDRYEGEMSNAIGEAVASRAWETLRSDRRTKQELAATLSDHLAALLKRDGMELVALQALEVHNPELEQLDDEQYRLHLRRRVLNLDMQDFEAEFDEIVAGLEQRGRRSALREKARDQELVEAKCDLRHEAKHQDARADHAHERGVAALEDHKRRADVYLAMERELTGNAKTKLTNDEDLAAFVHNVDKDRLLRAEDLRKFEQEIAEAGQDHELAREHLLLRLKAERQFELRAAQLGREQDLSGKAVAFQLDQQRRLLDHQLGVDRKKLDASIASTRASHAAELEMQAAGKLKTLELRRAEAQTDAEVAKADLEIQKLRDEHDMAIREKKTAMDLKEQSERMAMALGAQKQQFELQMQATAQRHGKELEEARIAADVEKTRVGSAQEIARARQEAAERRAADLERVSGERRDDADRLMDRMERVVTGTQDRIEQAHVAKDAISQDAMNRMQAVAQQASTSGPTVVQPTVGQATVVQSASSPIEAAIEAVCKACSAAMGASDAFCGECGEKHS